MMFNFFKKTKEDLQAVYEPQNIQPVSEAWKTSDGKLFTDLEAALRHQDRLNRRSIHEEFRTIYGFNSVDVDEILVCWEAYVADKLKSAEVL
jgi:hypothetical protein